RNVAMLFRVREKFAVAFVDENVEHSFFERGIHRVTVQVPVPIDQIDFDAAAQWFAPIHANGGITKIGPGFAVPGAELDDVDLVTGGGNEISAKLAREPARLEFELVRDS